MVTIRPAVSCLSADQGHELVVAVTEGQTVYAFLLIYIDQDLVLNLRNERALDVQIDVFCAQVLIVVQYVAVVRVGPCYMQRPRSSLYYLYK